MQTFLPYADFDQSLAVLDRQRLCKQRLEAWQILRACLGLTRGWVNHPATRMWRGHEGALVGYGRAACGEWLRRGYRDSLLEEFCQVALILPAERFIAPRWLGREDVHESHRANLVRKMPEYYGRLWPGVEPREGYVWPL
jgi:hypothetical protein